MKISAFVHVYDRRNFWTLLELVELYSHSFTDTYLTLTCYIFHQTMFADQIPVTMVDPVLKKAPLFAVCVKSVTMETGVNVSKTCILY